MTTEQQTNNLEDVLDQNQSEESPSPSAFLLGQFMKTAREVFVRDPKDPTYQLLRRIVPGVMKTTGYTGDIITEGVILGAYRFIDNLLGSTRK